MNIFDLTLEQKSALEEYKKQKGRYWKSKLQQAWLTGQYNWESDRVCYLQELRNQGGTRLLERV